MSKTIENTSWNKKKFLKIHFISLAVIIIAVIMLVACFYRTKIKSFYDNTLLTVASMKYNAELKSYKDKNDELFLEKQRRNYTSIAAKYLFDQGFSNYAFEHVTDWLNVDVAFAYRSDTGKITGTYNPEFFDFDGEVLSLLQCGASYHIDVDGMDYEYISERMPDGIVISYWPPEIKNDFEASDLFLNEDIYAAHNNVIILEKKSGTIISDSTSKLSDQLFSIDFETMKKVFVDGNVLYKGTLAIAGQKCLAVAAELNENYDLVVYSPLKTYLANEARDLVIPPVLLLLVFIVLTVCARQIMKKEYYSQNAEDTLVFKGRKLSKSVLAHFNALAVLGLVLLMGATAYFQVLTVLSSENIETREMLDALINNIDQNRQAEKELETDYYKSYSKIGEYIDWCLSQTSEEDKDQAITYFCASVPAVEEISIFDATGESILSTRTKYNYPLSKDKTDPDYACRALFETSNRVYVAVSTGRDDGTVYVAARRADNPGIIRLTIDTYELDRIRGIFSTQNAIAANNEVSGIEQGVFAYVDLSDTETLYWLENGASDCIENTLDSDVLKDDYSGQKRVNGRWYYINTEKGKNIILMSLLPSTSISGHFAGLLIIEAIAVITEFALFVLGGFVKSASENEAEIKWVEEFSDELDDLLKNYAGKMLAAVMGALLIILWIDNRFTQNSLLSYVYGMDWEKGYNLYSLTAIFITTTIAVVVAFVLTEFIKILFYKMGNKIIGIGQLLRSLIKIVACLVVVFFGLYQVGMNPTAMLASAGITSVIFAYGVKDVVNDIVYGILHLTDGIVSVGDMVSINGTEGKVVEVGFRQVVIETRNERKAFRNSKVNEIVKMNKKAPEKSGKEPKERYRSPKVIAVPREFQFNTERTDVLALLDLIDNNLEELKERIPGCLDKPVCEGITNFADGIVIITITILVEQSMAEYAVKALVNEIGILCLNNNLKI